MLSQNCAHGPDNKIHFDCWILFYSVQLGYFSNVINKLAYIKIFYGAQFYDYFYNVKRETYLYKIILRKIELFYGIAACGCFMEFLRRAQTNYILILLKIF